MASLDGCVAVAAANPVDFVRTQCERQLTISIAAQRRYRP
jgi:hypothetical protein